MEGERHREGELEDEKRERSGVEEGLSKGPIKLFQKVIRTASSNGYSAIR